LITISRMKAALMQTCGLPKNLSLALLLLTSARPSVAGDWPQWRGPARDGHAAADEIAPATLPREPKVIWRLEIGGGFSSPVVAGGKLAYLDGRDGKEVAHLIDAQTGKELWRVPYAEMYEDEWGPGPRSTPIIDGERVYIQSCNGEFRCLSLADGKVIWGTSFEKDFGVPFLGSKANEGTASRRGNNGTSVIDGDRIFVPVGSGNGASLVAFDKRSGKVLWKSQNDEAAYSSPMIGTLAGVRQVIYFSADALMGLKTDDGKLLWRVPLKTDAKRHAATPVIYGDSVIVNSQTIGLRCFKITKGPDGLNATPAWVNRDLKINISTPVLAGSNLYSQGTGVNLVCVDANNGNLLWSHDGFGERFGAAVAVGKQLLIVSDRGELVLVSADSSKYSELGRLQVCGKTWNSPAYAGGRLFVREGLTSGWKLSCLELTAATASSSQ
jgi:outer membrane protein assembly factor BamB